MKIKLATSLVALALLAALFCPATAEEKPAQGDVTVIGTVHAPTPNFTAETLGQILARAKPDVILFEVDSSFVDASFRLKEPNRKMTLEAIAVTAFQARSQVPLQPYDIEGRNQFYQDHNYFQRQRELSQALNQLSEEKRLEGEPRMLLEMIREFDAVRDAFAADRPEVINSAACDAAIEKKQEYAMKGMRRIVELTPALERFGDFAKLREEEWDRRNRTMAENVLGYARKNPEKRLVVLCGFEHRYFLMKLLRPHAAEGAIKLYAWPEAAH
jgi:hypothetical protein